MAAVRAVRLLAKLIYKQGITLVHYSAQPERFVWDRGLRVGVVWLVFRVLGGVEGMQRAFLCQTRLKLS